LALLQSELERVRYETGYNVLAVGAEPYVSYVAMFDKVVQVYLNAGAKTTSTTAVAASSPASPVSITLADPTGFTAGDRIVIDVDSRQEVVTAESLSGATLTVLLSQSHVGTYPLTVEGGESIIREKLQQIRKAQERLTTMLGAGTLKKVDEAEFYGTGEMTAFAAVRSALMALRDELASALGLPNLWRERIGGGGMAVNF
jgi:hypothetical protein